jgi:hypothetical protein
MYSSCSLKVLVHYAKADPKKSLVTSTSLIYLLSWMISGSYMSCDVICFDCIFYKFLNYWRAFCWWSFVEFHSLSILSRFLKKSSRCRLILSENEALFNSPDLLPLSALFEEYLALRSDKISKMSASSSVPLKWLVAMSRVSPSHDLSLYVGSWIYWMSDKIKGWAKSTFSLIFFKNWGRIASGEYCWSYFCIFRGVL